MQEMVQSNDFPPLSLLSRSSMSNSSRGSGRRENINTKQVVIVQITVVIMDTHVPHL